MTHTADLKGCREAFEREITSPPYEMDVSKYPDDSSYAWPNNYRDYKVELAWCMFKAAWNARTTPRADEGDGRDAARYRWAKANRWPSACTTGYFLNDGVIYASEDQAIDTAISASAEIEANRRARAEDAKGECSEDEV